MLKSTKSALLVLFVIVLTISLVVWGVLSLPWSKWFSKSVTIELEQKIGKTFFDSYSSTPGVSFVKNDSIQNTISEITSRLLASVNAKKYNYVFYLVKNDEPNAFTMPGGTIVIYTGLIQLARSPEELASVLAHEIGHAEQRHVVSKIIKQLGLSVVFSIFMGDGAFIGAELGKELLSTSFDRDQEREADDYGLKLLEQSSIDPKSMAGFFTKLNEKGLSYSKSIELIMTHPNNDSRISKSLTYAVSPYFRIKPFEKINWTVFKKQVSSAYLSKR